MAQDVTVGDKEMIRACKEALAERLGRDRFDVWFGSRVEWKIGTESLSLHFQDDFSRDWCYRRFYSDVSAVVSHCFQVAGRSNNCKTAFDVQVSSVETLLVSSNGCISESTATDTKQTLNSAENASGSERPVRGNGKVRRAESSAHIESVCIESVCIEPVCIEPAAHEIEVVYSSADRKQGNRLGYQADFSSSSQTSVNTICAVSTKQASERLVTDGAVAVPETKSVVRLSNLESNQLQLNESQSPGAVPALRIAGSSGSDHSSAKSENVVALPPRDEKRSTESVMPIAKQRTLTWENFVTGNCNKMAMATVEMVLKSPGVVTPLLVYGPCGSGKTHLVQALAQRFRQIHGARRVVYLSSEQFTNDFMEAIRGSGLPSFRRKYRDVECLILDDVQFLAGKRATLQELKHTLDTLLRQGRQVILVADRSLQELSILGPDVQARLTGGMVCPLEGLDEVTRRELLARLLAESRIKMAPKVIRELADKSSGDARVLFGLVNRLRALSLMLRGSFNEQQALEATQDLLTACQPTVRLSDIERAVCDVFGLEPKSLQAKGKTKTVSQPRMLAMFLARKYTRAAYAEIGDYFGHRRHSTVISAEKKVNEWLSDAETEDGSYEVAKIREALRNVEASLRVG